MSAAYQCDMCKQLFPGLIAAERCTQKYDITIKDKPAGHSKYTDDIMYGIDLCPKCYQKIEDMLEGRVVKFVNIP